MGRDAIDEIKPEDIKSFNPRARMGRDFQDYADDQLDEVSIHAPAWGATVAGNWN